MQLPAALVAGVLAFCRSHGVIVGRAGAINRQSNVISLSPPLVITRSECDTLIDVLDKALADAVATMTGAKN
jgi:4-aminobutyrate aminotransferase-like enzyme